MTIEQLRTIILQSKNPNWFNSVESRIIHVYQKTEKKFKGISSLYEYVIRQIEGWEKLGDTVPNALKGSLRYFEDIKDSIISFVKRNKDRESDSLEMAWENVIRKIESNSDNLVRYDSEETEFLIKVSNEFPKSFNTAFNFLFSKSSLSLHTSADLTGAILAYEFLHKDVSIILKRSKSELSSISSLKSKLDQYISDVESNYSIHLKFIEDKYRENVYTLEKWRDEKAISISNWFEKTQNNFVEFDNDAQSKIGSLEKTYEELLSLKKPADYWKTRAIELNDQGRKFLRWLVGIILFSCACLFLLLWLTPEDMLTSFFNEDKSAAIRWSIVFITFISFLAFGVRALTKITFSSFHLARDAEERERLTYVYLAMIKEASVEKEDRHLIMQSLFSRADTGLLKEDSTPTMPGAGSIIEKQINK